MNMLSCCYATLRSREKTRRRVDSLEHSSSITDYVLLIGFSTTDIVFRAQSRGYSHQKGTAFLILMLILKYSNEIQAMVKKDANYESEAIRRSTIAILFMGTPHRGSSFASKGEKLVNFTQALGMKASTSDLVLLQLESTKLDDLCSEFATLLNDRRIKILTYIESRPLRIGPMELLVCLIPLSTLRAGNS